MKQIIAASLIGVGALALAACSVADAEPKASPSPVIQEPPQWFQDFWWESAKDPAGGRWICGTSPATFAEQVNGVVANDGYVPVTESEVTQWQKDHCISTSDRDAPLR